MCTGLQWKFLWKFPWKLSWKFVSNCPDYINGMIEPEFLNPVPEFDTFATTKTFSLGLLNFLLKPIPPRMHIYLVYEGKSISILRNKIQSWDFPHSFLKCKMFTTIVLYRTVELVVWWRSVCVPEKMLSMDLALMCKFQILMSSHVKHSSL